MVLDGGDECKGAVGGAEKDFGWTFAELLPSTNHLLTTIRVTAKREKIYRLLSVGPGFGSPDSYLPILLLEQMRVPYEVTFVEIDKAAAAGLGETLAEALKLLGDEKRCGFYEIVSLDFMTYTIFIKS